jgi:glycosyltransferase 2 family protein
LQPSNKPTRWFRRLLPGLIFGFIIFLVFSLVGDIQAVQLRVVRFRWEIYPAVLGLTLFNYLLRWVKFHYYLVLIGAGGLPLRESVRLFVAGFPLAMTPGKVGEALKGVWIEWKTGQPAARGVAVVVAERISDGLAVLLLSLFGVFAYPQYWPAFILLLAVLLGLVILTQVPRLAESLLGAAERLPLVNKLAQPLRQFYLGSADLFRPRATLSAVGLGTVSWLGEGVGFYLILLGLELSPGWETFSIAVFVLAFSTAVGGASTLPGGLGAAEASITGMLILMLDMPAGTAITATLLVRLATLWFGVGLGLLAWLGSPELLKLGVARDLPAAS